MIAWYAGAFAWIGVLCSCSNHHVLSEACADGQQAMPIFTEPNSLVEFWNARRDDRHVAVLARRSAAPRIVPPRLGFAGPRPEPVFHECIEGADHEIVDGLGWIEADSLFVEGRTGRGFWGTDEGRPLPDVELAFTDFFFQPDPEGIATDDALYLLILQELPDGTLFLQWRASVTDGLVSGEHTLSGESSTLDDFRREAL